MSLVITRSLFCDGKDGDCPTWYGEVTDVATALLRKMAQRHGWRYRNRKDICPECATAASGTGTDGGEQP